MKTTPKQQIAMKPMTPARRDNQEIADWARTCGRNVTADELRCLRSLKRLRRPQLRLREVYRRALRSGGQDAPELTDDVARHFRSSKWLEHGETKYENGTDTIHMRRLNGPRGTARKTP